VVVGWLVWCGRSLSGSAGTKTVISVIRSKSILTQIPPSLFVVNANNKRNINNAQDVSIFVLKFSVCSSRLDCLVRGGNKSSAALLNFTVFLTRRLCPGSG